MHTPRPRWFTHELVPALRAVDSRLSVRETTLGPPSAQSPFAACRCYRHAGDVQRLLVEHYSHFIAPTGSCARPVALPPASASPRTDGLCRLLSAPAGHRPFPTLSLPILPHVSGPLLRLLPGCTRPLLPPGHWPSPRVERVGATRFSDSYFRRYYVSELQSFTDVQTRRFARHAGSSHLAPRGVRRPWLLHPRLIMARCLTMQRTCYPSKTGQLTERGLSPPKIGSLVGCSPLHVVGQHA